MGFSVSLHQIVDAVGKNTRDVLVRVAGIPAEFCDEKHHPCPACGGLDRFRVLDLEEGTCFCNRCFNKRNGNYINAVMHFRNVGFRDALLLIADYLGIRKEGTFAQAVPGCRASATSKKKAMTSKIKRVLHPIYNTDGSRKGMRVDSSCDGKEWSTFFPWNGFTYQPVPREVSANSHVKKHTIYEYLDADGGPHHIVYRLDLKQGRKIPMQFHWDGSAYVLGKSEEQIPYNAPDVLKAKRVFFVEGEKCAAALQWDLSRNPPEGEMPAVTCINCGCGAFSDSYIPYFEGKDLFIYPDNDAPGERLACELVEKLSSVCKSIKVYKWPDGTPEKWDIADEIVKRNAERKATEAEIVVESGLK
ncbi:MAG: primase-helicase zinc-binding domain-containing protein [Planctomycetia bacterium]|nr:primase-helicase zinc-binding domain-containing protein [Planctomycetia bacterium]